MPALIGRWGFLLFWTKFPSLKGVSAIEDDEDVNDVFSVFNVVWGVGLEGDMSEIDLRFSSFILLFLFIPCILWSLRFLWWFSSSLLDEIWGGVEFSDWAAGIAGIPGIDERFSSSAKFEFVFACPLILCRFFSLFLLPPFEGAAIRDDDEDKVDGAFAFFDCFAAESLFKAAGDILDIEGIDEDIRDNIMLLCRRICLRLCALVFWWRFFELFIELLMEMRRVGFAGILCIVCVFGWYGFLGLWGILIRWPKYLCGGPIRFILRGLLGLVTLLFILFEFILFSRIRCILLGLRSWWFTELIPLSDVDGS